MHGNVPNGRSSFRLFAHPIYGSPWTTGRNRSLCHNIRTAPVFGPEKGAIQNLESWADFNSCQNFSGGHSRTEDDYDIPIHRLENGAQVMQIYWQVTIQTAMSRSDPGRVLSSALSRPQQSYGNS